MLIVVRDNNVNQVLRILKKLQREGLLREIKREDLLRETLREAFAEEKRSGSPLPEIATEEDAEGWADLCT